MLGGAGGSSACGVLSDGVADGGAGGGSTVVSSLGSVGGGGGGGTVGPVVSVEGTSVVSVEGTGTVVEELGDQDGLTAGDVDGSFVDSEEPQAAAVARPIPAHTDVTIPLRILSRMPPP
ncbi:hypothetical protein [Streptomyces sp. NPDC090798]|uniref:hypothetical protein n=1 Tax=Streptomyces sp. NPDC090798 TaxID=3365968 RepID=UPI003825DDE6